MQYRLFQYSLKLTSLPAVGIDITLRFTCGLCCPAAPETPCPSLRLMSAPLNKPQKFAGTCTLPLFTAEPSCEPPPHAAVITAAATTAAHANVVFAFIP